MLPPVSESAGASQDGAGAGSAGIAGAGFFAGALRLGAAFLAIFFTAFFGADFTAFFLRAGAAFFALFFFAFDFFAMIVLPIHASNISSASIGDRVHATTRPSPRSARRHRSVHRPTPLMLPKYRRTWTPGSPIDQLHRMDGRELRARRDLRHAAKISRSNDIRSQSLDSPDFALTQPYCDIGLKNIVGSRRAAAQMAVRHILHCKAELGEQIFRLSRYALPVLQRTCRMISDA